MDSSFEDDIRRTAGLPTAAEVHDRQVAEERAAKALADDQPRQQALAARFEAAIAPRIDEVFKRAAAALADSDIRLAVYHTFPSELLADKAYVIEPKLDPNPPRGHHPKRVLISPLHFCLHADGKVSAAAPDVSSAPPTLRVGISTVKKPIEEFTSELIRSIFTDYIKIAARVARSAMSDN